MERIAHRGKFTQALRAALKEAPTLIDQQLKGKVGDLSHVLVPICSHPRLNSLMRNLT